MLSIAYGNWIHGRILEPVVGGFFQQKEIDGSRYPAGLINNFIKILNVVYVINCLWQLDPWKNTGASGCWVFSIAEGINPIHWADLWKTIGVN